MLVNKAILGGALACADGTVFIDVDGTVVTSNRMVLFVAEPVKKEVAGRVPFGGLVPLARPLSLAGEAVEALWKGIARDTMFKGLLEHADLTWGEKGEVKAGVRNGTQSSFLELRALGNSRGLEGWRRFVGDTWATAVSAGAGYVGGRVIYNRARLGSAIEAVEAACRYDGAFSPIFVYHCEKKKILWRCTNELTGQRVWIIFSWSEINEAWPELNLWEKGFAEKKKPVITRRSL